MPTKTSGFMGQELRKPDAQGRIAIGKEFADETFSVERAEGGDIILRPVVVMHKREAWLFANPEVLADVKTGLRQAAAGDTHDLGDFAQYAGLEDED